MESVDSSVVEQPTFALPRLEEIETYLESADASALAAVEKAARRGEFDSEELRGDLTLWAKHLAESLPAPPLDDRDRRVIRLLLTLGCPDAVGDAWYHRVLGEEHAGHDVHGIVREELEGLGFDEVGVAAFTLNHLSPLEKEGSPTSAGRYLISLDDRTLKKSILELESVRRSVDAVEFFLEYDGRRVPSLTDSFFKAASTPRALPALCRRLLLRGGQEYVRPVMRVFRKLQDDWQRFRVTHALANVAPDEYRDDAIERAFSLFEDLSWIERESRSDYVKKFLEITSCLVNHLGREALMHILPFLSVPEDHSSFEPCWEKEFYDEAAKLFPEDIADDLLGRVKKAHASPSALEQHETLKRIALNKSVKHLGRSALVASIAAIDAGSLTTRLEGVVQLLEFGGGETYSRIVHKEIERGLRRGGELDTLRFLGLARHMGVKSFLEDILQLLKHKNRNVREEATRTLTPLGDDVLRGAGTILESGSVAHRAGVVQMLLTMRSREALRLLEEHAEHEENARVRNAIREGLARSGSIHQFGKRDLERCVDRIRKEVEAFRVKWLDWNVVPPLHFTDGRPLSRITVQYLLNRQSRSREMTPQGGARSLYHLVDRKRSGDFALHLLEAYLESGAGSTDRWALAVAGILGDHKGSVAREVMITLEEWEQIKAMEEAAESSGALVHDEETEADDPEADEEDLAYEDDPEAADEADEDVAEDDSEEEEEEGEAEEEDDEELEEPEGEYEEDEVEDEDEEEEELEDEDEEEDAPVVETPRRRARSRR